MELRSLSLIVFLSVGSRNVIIRSGEDDVLTIPDDVWDAEKNWTASHPNGGNIVRQVGNDLTPPAQACITIKFVYNNAWVQSSANGNAANAAVAARAVVNEAQKIYNDRYVAANRFGTTITFNLVGGGTCSPERHKYFN